MIVSIIAAMTPDGIIGVNGALPWHYKADLQRFKARTMGSAIIFGSRTYESLPGRLAGRHVLVVSRGVLSMKLKHWPDGVYGSLEAAIHAGKVRTKTETVWVGGGAEVYKYALERQLVNLIDLTIVPPIEIPQGAKVTHFPLDLLVGWQVVDETTNADDPRLLQRLLTR